MLSIPQKADICLFLEGTYPYVAGGVSNWTHELIKMQSHLTFHVVALVGKEANTNLCFELPENVVGVTTVVLQKLPKGVSALPSKESNALFAALEQPLLNLQQGGSLQDLEELLKAIAPFKHKIGRQLLFNSYPAWDLLVSMYNNTMADTAFLDYFWSWRTLFGGLYSILFAPLPEASVYHSLCTGYAGLFLARARLETGKPCLVTEHGIYTNERRIEIASADWLEDQKSLDLGIAQNKTNRELKDFWIDMFSSYSHLCYEASSTIITLYEGNQTFQIMDGADPAKLRIIPNGVDYAHFASTVRQEPHPPTIALIGRVVPIKDIKTFIRAISIIKATIPHVRAWVMGPADEDRHYYEECLEIVEHEGLEDTLSFTGNVKIKDYLGEIDVIALTSISEAQPLVILEAGAASIPTVATDVGACHEMIMGRMDETPPLGAGGGISPLASAKGVAHELLRLLTDPVHYQACSTAIRQRVERYYNKEDQHKAYAELYRNAQEGRVLEEKWLVASD